MPQSISSPIAVNESRLVELVYTRSGGTSTYAEAVESPLDALINALSAENWEETPTSALGLIFTRQHPVTGLERLVIRG